MKTMNNFAAQQLTKMQMNQVTGGGVYECNFSNGGAPQMTMIFADSKALAESTLTAAGGNGVNCRPV